MNQPWHVITLLEADNSRLAKEGIIKREATDANTDFFKGVSLALNSLVTFGLKQIKEKSNQDGPGLTWDEFYSTVTTFTDRTCTGNAARDTIDNLIKLATTDQWNNWYRRILIKDLRCGVSVKTVNKVVGQEYSIPVFSAQLAHDSSNHENKLVGKKLIEVKLDGVRVLTIVYPEGRVDQFSRNGKELVNFEHIKHQISLFANKFNEPMVLDGEVMSSSFQDLMTQINRKSDVDAKDAVLYLFDIIPLADFENGICNNSQEERSASLAQWYNASASFLFNVNVVAQELVDLDTDEGDQQLQEINARAIKGGYEGIMMKDPTAIYVCKRSHAWLKLKPFIEVSLEIVDVEEGTGKNVGRLGAIVCEGVDDGTAIRVNVGGGYTDANRIKFWDNRSDLPGNIVEVRADAITQNRDGTYSLRFPRFRRFRGFTPGEKL